MSTVHDVPETVHESSRAELDPAPQEPARRPGPWARWSPVLVLLGFSVLVLVLTLDMPTGTPRTPGPGLWPLVASILLVLVSALLVVTRNHSGQEPWTRGARTVIGAIASLLIFIVFFPMVGFTLPAIVLSLLWLKVFGRERWTTTVVTAVIAPILLYLLFDEVLGVSLPWDLLMSTILGA